MTTTDMGRIIAYIRTSPLPHLGDGLLRIPKETLMTKPTKSPHQCSKHKNVQARSTHDIRGKLGPYFGMRVPPEAELRIGQHITSESSYHYLTLTDKFLRL